MTSTTVHASSSSSSAFPGQLPESPLYESLIARITRLFLASHPPDFTSIKEKVDSAHFLVFVEGRYEKNSDEYKACQIYLRTLPIPSPLLPPTVLQNSTDCFERVLMAMERKELIHIRIDKTETIHQFIAYVREKYGVNSEQWRHCKSFQYKTVWAFIKTIRLDKKASFYPAYKMGKGMDLTELKTYLDQEYGIHADEDPLYEWFCTHFHYERLLQALKYPATSSYRAAEKIQEETGVELSGLIEYVNRAYKKTSPSSQALQSYKRYLKRQKRETLLERAKGLWEESRKRLREALSSPGIKLRLREEKIDYKKYTEISSYKELVDAVAKDCTSPPPTPKGFLSYLKTSPRKKKGSLSSAPLCSFVETHQEMSLKEFQEKVTASFSKESSEQEAYSIFWKRYTQNLRQQVSRKRKELLEAAAQRIVDEHPFILAIVGSEDSPSAKRRKINLSQLKLLRKVNQHLFAAITILPGGQTSLKNHFPATFPPNPTLATTRGQGLLEESAKLMSELKKKIKEFQ